ncbi:MAG: hypothetical protein GKR89_26490 [Candidatus Latescibacteria bacterium]|nr:hypothetical protein [Candidatus Latescibacterota bacterium]
MAERILAFLTGAAVLVLLLAAVWRSPIEKEQRTAETPVRPLAIPVRIEVLNGCGVSQIAARLTQKARALGLDIIHEGNASSFNFLHTLVIDRSGDIEKARQVARVMGIPHCIQQVVDEALRLADVSIVIGRDYRSLGLLSRPVGQIE